MTLYIELFGKFIISLSPEFVKAYMKNIATYMKKALQPYWLQCLLLCICCVHLISGKARNGYYCKHHALALWQVK